MTDREIKDLLLLASDEVASQPFEPGDDLWRARAALRRRRMTSAGFAVGALVAIVAALLVGQQALGRTAATVPAAPAPQATSRGTPSPSVDSRQVEELLVGSAMAHTLSLPQKCAAPALAFSPDGRRVAIGCVSLTFVIDIPGGHERLLNTGAQGVAWTSDGEQLVLAKGSSLEVVTPDDPGHAPAGIPLPTGWSVRSVDIHDGRAVLGGTIGERSSIMTMDLTGAHPTVVSTRPDVATMLPRWSPDGTRIGYLQRNSPDTSPDYADVGVWTIDANGGDPQLVIQYGKSAFLGHAPGFDWSPTGRMAFTTGANGSMDVVVIEADGQRTDLKPGAGGLAWRPTS